MPNKPYDTLVTKFSFCHNSCFNKKGSHVSSRARFLILHLMMIPNKLMIPGGCQGGGGGQVGGQSRVKVGNEA